MPERRRLERRTHQRWGIVTGGTWCVDRNRLLACWPDEDAACEILSEEWQGGGSACNLAIDIRTLDPLLAVETIGLVGEDADGRFLLDQADRHGIARAQLATTPNAATHYADCYTSRGSGRRTHIFSPGASARLTPAHFDLHATSGRILHLGLPGAHLRMDQPSGNDANGWVTVLRRARQAGLQTNLELASLAADRLAPLVRPCLPHLDLLVVNDTEIGIIAGKRTVERGRTDIEACIAAGRLVLENGAMRVVVVHFPLGAIALARDGTVLAQAALAIPASEIVGANGAGDAFAAGFLYGQHEGWGLAESLRLAHAAAACSLRALSTTGGVEPWGRCLDHAARWGARAGKGFALDPLGPQAPNPNS